VPNGIDVALFDRDDGIDPYERFGLPRDGLMVFFANRMEERKGIHLVRDMCFRVMRKYRHVHFVFAGNDLFGYMQREILPFIEANDLKSRFHYLGQLDLPSVRAILKRIHVFLIPSLWENCPYSCIEAMTAGRAIVASDCGGMPELIEDGKNGLLARNGDSASFVEALERMIEDDDLRRRVGPAARARVEHDLTDVAVAERSVAIYRGHRPAQT
jgi:starch synthase